ncbi:MAG: glycosyltransferase family 4 protein [Candidatus Binatia bacterium]
MPPSVTVVQIITQLELGGAQEIALSFCRDLDRDRYRMHLITGPGGLLDDEARSIPGLGFEHEPHLVRELRPATDVACVGSLAARLRRLRSASPAPMIVHTHSSKAGILARWAAVWAGAEIRIHHIHGFGFHPEQPWPVRRAFQAAEQLTAPITHAFVPVSEANRKVAESLGMLRGGRIAVVLPPGIDAREYEPEPGEGAAFRRELGIPPDAPVVGMIACLKRQKSPRDFVLVAGRVAARRPETHFFIAGDGALRAEVEEEIAKQRLNGRFHLPGWRRDVRAAFAAADVLVLTSLWEGLPRVCFQAMAAKKPLVATRVDGIPEAVEDGGNGFLLEPHDLGGFADRILELLGNPDRARAMGAAGYRHLDRFDAGKMRKQLEQLYERLLDTRGLSGPAPS